MSDVLNHISNNLAEIPSYLVKILKRAGYNNAISLSKFNSDSQKLMEKMVRNQANLILSDTDFFEYYDSRDDFELIPGHVALIDGIKDMITEKGFGFFKTGDHQIGLHPRQEPTKNSSQGHSSGNSSGNSFGGQCNSSGTGTGTGTSQNNPYILKIRASIDAVLARNFNSVPKENLRNDYTVHFVQR
jgi:hypothetical protein